MAAQLPLTGARRRVVGCVAGELRQDSGAARLRVEVDDDAGALPLDRVERSRQELAAVAQFGVEHVAGQTAGVDVNEHPRRPLDVALHARDVEVQVRKRPIRERAKSAPPDREVDLDDAFDEPVHAMEMRDQVGDRELVQSVRRGEGRESRGIGDPAVGPLDLADHGRLVEAGEPDQVERRLGASGALQDPARRGAEWLDPSRRGQVAPPRGRVDGHLDRVGLIVRADPIRDAGARVDRVHEGGVARFLGSQPELVAALVREREADPAPGLAV